MTVFEPQPNPEGTRPQRFKGLFNNIKFFVLCHGMLQLSQLLVSGYLKGSITTIEKRYGFSSSKSGLLAAFNEASVGNTVLIVFVSFFGSHVHRPRCIGIGAMIASMGVFLIALPHFISDQYNYTESNSNSADNNSELCQAHNLFLEVKSNRTCNQEENSTHYEVYPILLLGQLLLGIGGVPIQPFGISYIDDFAEKKNSPFYLGILFAVTVIGPAFGYILSSVVLRLFVDIDKMNSGDINLKNEDPRWVGAWWLGFLIAATLLFLTSLPYLFFPRKMSREEVEDAPVEPSSEKMMEDRNPTSDQTEEASFIEFLKSFPKVVLRTLRTPIFLLVVFAQVNLAAMVAGLATFMGKFIEKQFAQTASFSNMMMGTVNIPSAMLGIMAGGVILRKLGLTVRSSAAMCTIVVLVSIMFAIPLLFIGCPTQQISGVNYIESSSQQCSQACSCSSEAFNPVCGSDGVEFRSPCHAGCKSVVNISATPRNYTDCGCGVSGYSPGFALGGPCNNGCRNRLIPFMILSSLTCFVASLSHTTSFMMILRTVIPEDKSFALGIQFMLFRVLGNKFLGLQIFFIFGGFVCFLLSFMVLRRTDSSQQNQAIATQTKNNRLQELKEAKQMMRNSNGHCSEKGP
ncbi:hypothetical protein DNTS_021786 [Danionella cerebrum]|uniref:Solute carrier organic anion transporter family member n=1 Tax=Danionella cerebrum TaxID=2873325 RepID=A0A553R845_9TELE|nr:hypothetical protein DNTS_021786 [Danionella translucida]TRY98360.1 hypothetical protein DNTS_021786 [Danionella translucida]